MAKPNNIHKFNNLDLDRNTHNINNIYRNTHNINNLLNYSYINYFLQQIFCLDCLLQHTFDIIRFKSNLHEFVFGSLLKNLKLIGVGHELYGPSYFPQISDVR